jgi:hypothetical protein
MWARRRMRRPDTRRVDVMGTKAALVADAIKKLPKIAKVPGPEYARSCRD